MSLGTYNIYTPPVDDIEIEDNRSSEYYSPRALSYSSSNPNAMAGGSSSSGVINKKHQYRLGQVYNVRYSFTGVLNTDPQYGVYVYYYNRINKRYFVRLIPDEDVDTYKNLQSTFYLTIDEEEKLFEIIYIDSVTGHKGIAGRHEEDPDVHQLTKDFCAKVLSAFDAYKAENPPRQWKPIELTFQGEVHVWVDSDGSEKEVKVESDSDTEYVSKKRTAISTPIPILNQDTDFGDYKELVEEYWDISTGANHTLKEVVAELRGGIEKKSWQSSVLNNSDLKKAKEPKVKDFLDAVVAWRNENQPFHAISEVVEVFEFDPKAAEHFPQAAEQYDKKVTKLSKYPLDWFTGALFFKKCEFDHGQRAQLLNKIGTVSKTDNTPNYANITKELRRGGLDASLIGGAIENNNTQIADPEAERRKIDRHIAREVKKHLKNAKQGEQSNNTTSTYGQGNQPKWGCFWCGRTNHSQQDCRDKKAGKEQTQAGKEAYKKYQEHKKSKYNRDNRSRSASRSDRSASSRGNSARGSQPFRPRHRIR